MGLHLRKNFRNRYLFIADLLFIAISVFLSYMLRFELGMTFQRYLPSTMYMLVAALVIKPLIYYLFGMYRRLWIYASTNELRLIVAAVLTSSAILSAVMVIFGAMKIFVGFPRSVLIIDGILSLIFVGGLRFSVRMIAEMDTLGKHRGGFVNRALIVGAGDAGAIVCKEIRKNPQLNVKTVGFVDDDPKKQMQEIYGYKVLGTVTDIQSVIERNRIGEVFFAIPSAPGRVVRLVSDVCRKKGIPFRTMPGIYEMLGGKISINRLRDVDISDLLRRDQVKLDQDYVGPLLRDKVVLVSGAGGSIGGELCRQIARFDPAKLIMLGHGENSIFETVMDMKSRFPALNMVPVIADVRDEKRINWVFDVYQPQIVFHAAAHKHVHLMEENVEEAVKNNICGTFNMVQAASSHHVERFVMISTDKAVRPANVMGATKRIAENLVLNASEKSDTLFTVVRFGNVLGSRGSVVPLFKKQISAGGPVTVTDPSVERYFMTIPEAVYLVLESAGLGSQKETFVLDMGKQVRILDLAEDLIRLSGLEPGRDIEIQFTGLKPGEKLSEELWNEGQVLKPTIHPDIFKLDRDDLMDDEELTKTVRILIDMAYAGRADDIRRMMDDIIPDAKLDEVNYD